MIAEQRCRAARPDRLLEHRSERRPLRRPGHQQDQLARPAQRPEPDGERLGRNAAKPAERRGRVGAGLLRERRPGGRPRPAAQAARRTRRGRRGRAPAPRGRSARPRPAPRGARPPRRGRSRRRPASPASRRHALERGAELRGEARGSLGAIPAYSSSCRTVAPPLGSRPAAACARSASYMLCGERPVGSSSRACGRADSRLSTSSAATDPTRRASSSTSGAGASSVTRARRAPGGPSRRPRGRRRRPPERARPAQADVGVRGRVAVRIGVHRDAEEREPLGRAGADRRRALADAAGEHRAHRARRARPPSPRRRAASRCR